MKSLERFLILVIVVLFSLVLMSCAPEQGPKGERGVQGPPGESYTEVIYPCEIEANVTVFSKKNKKVERIEIDIDNQFCGVRVNE